TREGVASPLASTAAIAARKPNDFDGSVNGVCGDTVSDYVTSLVSYMQGSEEISVYKSDGLPKRDKDDPYTCLTDLFQKWDPEKMKDGEVIRSKIQ
ncbi:hypothetical protein MKW94_013532, partial [Papaver nudicaule]|nr:hypothetical protein [Papaver nudicaule]